MFVILLRLNISWLWKNNRIFGSLLFGVTAWVCCLLIFIVGFVVQEAFPFFFSDRAWTFISTDWYPTDGWFGHVSMLVGSLLVTGIALIIAGPFGIAVAICIHFYLRGRLANILEFIFDILTGMPSVVLGLWGLTALVPVMSRWSPSGTHVLTAGIVLALMVVPTVIMTSLASFRLVPTNLRQAAQALQLSQATFIIRIAIPAAKSGLYSGIVLACVRAFGETMAVLMVAGNIAKMPKSIMDPVRTLTSNIALEMAYALDTHRASLYMSGLLLIACVTVLVFIQASIRTKDVAIGQ